MNAARLETMKAYLQDVHDFLQDTLKRGFGMTAPIASRLEKTRACLDWVSQELEEQKKADEQKKAAAAAQPPASAPASETAKTENQPPPAA